VDESIGLSRWEQRSEDYAPCLDWSLVRSGAIFVGTYISVEQTSCLTKGGENVIGETRVITGLTSITS
jgi:hypothetical protein